MKLVYTVLVLAALVYAERRLIEPRLTGARLSALVQAALVYTVLVYQEWIRFNQSVASHKTHYRSTQSEDVTHEYSLTHELWNAYSKQIFRSTRLYCFWITSTEHFHGKENVRYSLFHVNDLITDKISLQHPSGWCWKMHVCFTGSCSNALAFANANAAFALALAFDSPLTAAFALAFAFDSSAFALAFDSNAFDWIKCESNASVLLLIHNGYFVSWFLLE